MPVQQSSPHATTRVSRESRRLLTALTVGLVALLVLGRLRYSDRPAAANAMPPILTQLARPNGLIDIADEVARLQEQLSPSLLVPGSAADTGRRYAALRVGNGFALMILNTDDGDAGWKSLPIEALDRVTGLALVRTDEESPGVAPVVWRPRQLERPGYFVTTLVWRGNVSLRPVFVDRLYGLGSAEWADTLWALPPTIDLEPGTFVFTTDGELAGAVVTAGRGLAVVPAATLFARVEQLRAQPHRERIDLGLEVQPLTPLLAAAASATAGVIVRWVDPAGPAAKQVQVGDVVESVNGSPAESVDKWGQLIAALTSDDNVVLTVRRDGRTRDVTLAGRAQAPAAGPKPLGLFLRGIRRVGAEVSHVTVPSAAHAAGLRAGDVITHAGSVAAPTPGQIAQAFDALAGQRSLMLAFTRDGGHYLVALEK